LRPAETGGFFYGLMPSRPRRPCAQPGCPELVSRGCRCAAHPLPDRHEKTATRGYDAAWQRLSRQRIAEQPWCSWLDDPQCSWSGERRELTCDHLVPLSQGGASVRENLRVLCRGCNSRARWISGGHGDRNL
jgi:5-methylcytosine-specific restriction protein A